MFLCCSFVSACGAAYVHAYSAWAETLSDQLLSVNF